MALPPPYEQPPVYDQLLPLDIVGDPSPPTHVSALVHSTAQEAIVAQLATPETKTKLVQEVEALADSALKVNESFERIKVGLGKIDEKNYEDKDGNLVDKFQPTWMGYQKVRVVLMTLFALLRISPSVGLIFSGVPATWPPWLRLTLRVCSLFSPKKPLPCANLHIQIFWKL